MKKPKLIRITTVPISLNLLLKGQLAFMREHFDVLAVSSGPDEELEEVGRRENVPIMQVDMTRSITPMQDIKAFWQLYELFKKEKPLIVHTHTPKAGTVGMLAAKMAGVPHRLHTVAGMPLMEITGIKRNVVDTVEWITYSCATKVYPNSNNLKKYIIENGYCKASKLSVIANGSSNGIDTTHFHLGQVSDNEKATLKQKLGISDNDFVFIFIGRMVGDKGINELVSAFASLCERSAATSSTPKLLLVGSLEIDLDPLNPETIHEIKTNPNILQVGFQKDVRPYYAISNALVFPSYREGFPNVVMQAGAMGLPAIVTNINGCNEIIEEGKNGTLIPAKGETLPTRLALHSFKRRSGQAGTSTQEMQEALLKAMQLFIQDKEYYNKLKQNARPMICERYEQQVVWEALLEEYRGLSG